MITLLGSMLGFFSSFAPEILRLFRDSSDKAHEITLLKMQMEQQSKGSQTQLEEIKVHADVAESRLLYGTFNSNIRWVDALNGTVRPMIAYGFFVLYASVKCISAYSGMPWLLWTEEDQAIFAGIISFYFGQRAISKLRFRR